MKTLTLSSPIPSVSSVKKIGLWLGPLAFAVIGLVLPEVLAAHPLPLAAAGVLAWMCVWWFTEAVDVAWTSCLPFPLFVLTGVYTGSLTARLRGTFEPALDAYLLLFLGGMVIGAAMEESGLHRRLATRIIARIGNSPRRILAGVLLSTAFVSMWISNTATAVMMVPIALALSAAVGEQHRRYRLALLLGVAYASSIGGLATKIGSSTNSVFAAFVADQLHTDLSFIRYSVLAAPFAALLLPLTWLLLWRTGSIEQSAPIALDTKPGHMTGNERWVAFVFLASAALWTVSDLIAERLGLPGKHVEAATAVVAGLTLIAARTVNFAKLKKIPFGTLVLMAGSFALAAGMMKSGLSAIIATQLSAMAALPLIAQLAIASSATIGLSAVASNTATVNVMLNVLPRSLPLLTASALAASCDFALPAGTPPNAIVFATGAVPLKDMLRVGLLLDVLAGVALTLYAYAWIA